MSFVHVSGATDLLLIIPHFSPRHTQSAHCNPHSIDIHCLVHRCALIAQTHTCASESNVALVTSGLEGAILGLLARQPGAAQHGHAHTSPSASTHCLLLLSSLALFYHPSVFLNLSTCNDFSFSLSFLSLCSFEQSSSGISTPGLQI